MLAIYDEQGPVRLVGCAPLYKLPQTRWTRRLTAQLTVYVLLIGMSMAAGGLMPWLLEVFHGWKIGGNHSLHNMFSQHHGYGYSNANAYAFCPKNGRVYNYDPLPRGYPAPPLAPKGGKLYDAWHHTPVTLKGVSWFGFNNAQGGPDGLWAGGSEAATDFAAIVYELKLLGFNTVRLPFTFDMLQKHGSDLVHKCSSSSTSDLAQHTTDPQASPAPDYSVVPDAPILLQVEQYHAGLCNTHMPRNASHVVQRLLWTVQFLIGNGFYVVLDYHPSADDHLATDARDFARAWLYTWATITCLPNFASDIRGRLILDLLNEPDKLGLSWTERDGMPGLDTLYLTAMDSIESATEAAALYMVQGAALSTAAVGMAGESSVRLNKFGLSPGDGFVTDRAIIDKFLLSDPNPFFQELLQRPYRNSVLLGPHLYASENNGPGNSGSEHTSSYDILPRLRSSWGLLATEGYCYLSNCMKFPVVAGEMGSRLTSPQELAYYDAVAQYARLGQGADGIESPLVGWIWWAYNANSAGTGGLVSDDWQEFVWPKLRYLIQNFGLQPWYVDVKAYLGFISTQREDAMAVRAGADAEAFAAATRAAAAAAANPALNLTSITEAVLPVKPTYSSAEAAVSGMPRASGSHGAVVGSIGGANTKSAGANAWQKAAANPATTGNMAINTANMPLPAVLPVQQNAEGGYVTFDHQPPRVIGAPQVGPTDVADASATEGLHLTDADAAAVKPAEPMNSHAILPANDWESSSYEVPATVVEAPNAWDVPADVQELPV